MIDIILLRSCTVLDDPPVQSTTVTPEKPLASNKISETPPKDLNPDRRFNVVVYGIKESPPNTSRYNRSQNDLKELSEALLERNMAKYVPDQFY